MPKTFLSRALAAVYLLALSYSASAQPRATNDFIVFDALLYQGKPDLRPYGMSPLRGANSPAGVSADPMVPLEESTVRSTMQLLPAGYTGPIFLDFEAWPLTAAPPQAIENSVKKYIQVVDIAQRTVPSAQFGIYGLIPCRDYWAPVARNARKLADWNECNRQAARVADHVAVLFPSLYTFYNDQAGWDLYAQGMLEAARVYHKPVYVFLWPEFHPSNRFVGGKNIPANFWHHQLDFCRVRADGVVIWGGWKEPWQDDAPWWSETKAFLATLNPR